MNLENNAVIDQLARTRGWTLFFAIMLWLGAALLLLSGIAMAILGSMGSSLGAAGANSPLGGLEGPLLGIGIGIFYFILALIYIYPALKLTKFSKKVSDLMKVPSEEGLVSALDEQRGFWKYVGIMMILFIAFYILIIIGAMIFGIMGASAMKSAG